MATGHLSYWDFRDTAFGNYTGPKRYFEITIYTRDAGSGTQTSLVNSRETTEKKVE